MTPSNACGEAAAGKLETRQTTSCCGFCHSAFCSSLQTVLGHEASRSKGLEIPDALKLLERLDLKGKIVTGDAIFCQKSIAAKIVERGGDYVFPVKDNQKTLRQDIETAFNEPVFPRALME